MSFETQGDDVAPRTGPQHDGVAAHAAPTRGKPKPLPFLRRPVLTGAAAVALGLAAFGAGHILSPAVSSAQQIRTVAPKAGTMLPGFADLVERVSPAVVSLEVVAVADPTEGPSPDDLEGLPPQWRRFFEQMPNQRGQARPREQRGGGSGFFITASGYIVTNNHVVEKAREITATLKDGRELKATVVGRDERTDLAVLKVEGNNFPFVQFAPEAKVRVGDWVVAIGNPFGLGGTATAGIVSALGRDIRNEGNNIADFIQIDAPINPGNSGGPTFDMSGRVIGVNTAIFSRSGGNVGIGFAIPSELADRTTKQIIEQGKVTYGWLGVVIQDLNRDMAESFGLSSDAKGALINNVTAGAPAAKAGLKRGDLVLSFNGQKIEGSSDLTRRVGQTTVGSVVRLEVLGADGNRRTVPVTIAARPSEAQLNQNNPLGGDRSDQESETQLNSLGLSVGPLSAQARTRLRLQPTEPGVLILDVDPDSRAAERGIRPGDAILTANGKELRSAADLDAELAAARSAGRSFISLFIQSQTGGGGFVALPLDNKPAGGDPAPKK
ncbi:periplasmic serine endoprotease DegP [Candidatus Phycosocius bacilliformis]|uniref:Periplasmic serine endoprotease DegP n=1 Tax=Candidatus Phycosocius bacilliformis TaxID=1445552 RepID=A0A2P2EAV9_9PROT|nr:Do family serine endopeptidase [Candidatus Phycosocius bacilliformis]GBF58198.1 periplasmic serine endoprotease DegP [Candidatus Phycosocius bacilliformis]